MVIVLTTWINNQKFYAYLQVLLLRALSQILPLVLVLNHLSLALGLVRSLDIFDSFVKSCVVM